MKNLIHNTTSIIALALILSSGFAFAQDQVEQSFQRAFSTQKADWDFAPVQASWDRFLAEPYDGYFANVRYSFVKQMGAPLTINTITGNRSPQTLAMAGWDDIITDKELHKGTRKSHIKLAKK